MSQELSVLGHLLSLNFIIISCKASLPTMNSQSALFGHLIFAIFNFEGQFCWLWVLSVILLPAFGFSIFETMWSAALLCVMVAFLSSLLRFFSLAFSLVIITCVDVDLCYPNWSLSSFLAVSTSITHQM